MLIQVDESAYSKHFHNVLYSWDRYIIAYGGRGCFHAGQKIVTDSGFKYISEFKHGEIVRTINEITGAIEFKPVRRVFKYKISEPVFKILLINGCEIIATLDHKFSFGGTWVSLESIVSLWNGRNLENNTGIFAVHRKQHGIHKNALMEGQRQGGDNEASQKQKWVFENGTQAGRRKVSRNNYPSDYLHDVQWAAERPYVNSKPQKPHQRRQSSGKPGMDDGNGEFTGGVQCGSILYSKRRTGREFNPKGIPSSRNQGKIQKASLHEGNVGYGVRGESLHDKGCSPSQELELADIDSVQIVNSITEVYDLNVQDNHNYFLDCGKQILVHNSGKTDTFFLKYLLSLFEPYYFKLAYINQEFSGLRDNQYAGFKRVAKRMGLYDHLKFYDGDYRIVNPKNGNSLIPRGMDDPEKTKGLDNITAIWWDEINKGTLEGFRALNELLRSPEATYLQFAMSFNPVRETSWLRETFFSEDAHALHPNYKKDTLLNRSTYLDNEFINQKEYLVTLGKSDNGNNLNAVLVNILGDWGQAEPTINPFLYEYSEDRHVNANAIYNPSLPLILSMDFNVNPLCGIFAQYFAPTKTCRIIDEVTIADGNIGALCKHIEKKLIAWGTPKSRLLITGDRNGAAKKIGMWDNKSSYIQIQEELRLSKMQFKLPGNPFVKNSRVDCNDIFEKWDITIHPDCKKLRADCQTVGCNADGDIMKKNRKNDSERADHMDSVRYLCNTFLK